jgi:hypothetical protein
VGTPAGCSSPAKRQTKASAPGAAAAVAHPGVAEGEREGARAGDVNRRRGKTDEGLGTWRRRERERTRASPVGWAAGALFSCFSFTISLFISFFDLGKEYYVLLKKGKEYYVLEFIRRR